MFKVAHLTVILALALSVSSDIDAVAAVKKQSAKAKKKDHGRPARRLFADGAMAVDGEGFKLRNSLQTSIGLKLRELRTTKENRLKEKKAAEKAEADRIKASERDFLDVESLVESDHLLGLLADVVRLSTFEQRRERSDSKGKLATYEIFRGVYLGWDRKLYYNTQEGLRPLNAEDFLRFNLTYDSVKVRLTEILEFVRRGIDWRGRATLLPKAPEQMTEVDQKSERQSNKKDISPIREIPPLFADGQLSQDIETKLKRAASEFRHHILEKRKQEKIAKQKEEERVANSKQHVEDLEELVKNDELIESLLAYASDRTEEQLETLQSSLPEQREKLITAINVTFNRNTNDIFVGADKKLYTSERQATPDRPSLLVALTPERFAETSYDYQIIVKNFESLIERIPGNNVAPERFSVFEISEHSK
jgi:hypothetical protein